MTDILFSININVFGFDGTTLAYKSLFPSNACININSLSFVFILLGPHYVLTRRVCSLILGKQGNLEENRETGRLEPAELREIRDER